ncbi:MAG: PGPGW domain-containing protein [Parvularcula sp.]|nr:PGPGW domain-containing protein [Parvularcula sp.]
MGALAASILTFLHKVTGGLLVVFGIVLFPMPIPVGLVMIALGLLFLAPYFKPVQIFVRSLRRRYGPVDRALLRIKQRCPSVLRSAIEKTAP